MKYVVKVVKREITSGGKTFNSYRTVTNNGERVYVSFVKGCPEPQGDELIRVDIGDYNKDAQKIYITEYKSLRNLSPEEIASVEPDTLEGLFNPYDDDSYLDTAKL